MPHDYALLQICISILKFYKTEIFIHFEKEGDYEEDLDFTGVNYDDGDNSISKQYTRWVEAMDDRIQDEMERVKDSK